MHALLFIFWGHQSNLYIPWWYSMSFAVYKCFPGVSALTASWHQWTDDCCPWITVMMVIFPLIPGSLIRALCLCIWWKGYHLTLFLNTHQLWVFQSSAEYLHLMQICLNLWFQAMLLQFRNLFLCFNEFLQKIMLN